MLKKIFHWFSHLLGTNSGKVATWQEDGYIHVGFECECGKIDPKSVHKIIESEIINEPN
jgi:hypothetical protein